MPQDITRIYTQPTYVVNQVKGWETRLIYSHFGDWSNNNTANDFTLESRVDYTQYCSDNSITDLSENIFTVIKTSQDNQQDSNTFYNYIYKGGAYGLTELELPAGYWKTGKTLRVKGAVIIKGWVDGDRFNIRAGIADSDNTYTALAYPNGTDGQHHVMEFSTESYDSENGIYVPFEINYGSVVVNNVTNNNSYELYVRAEGHYQYANPNISNYKNKETKFIPMYIYDDPYKLISSVNGSTKLRIDFCDSQVDIIYISYITVEELS